MSFPDTRGRYLGQTSSRKVDSDDALQLLAHDEVRARNARGGAALRGDQRLVVTAVQVILRHVPAGLLVRRRQCSHATRSEERPVLLVRRIKGSSIPRIAS
jgi:hypothetical protein